MSVWTRTFWADTAERALRTAAQAEGALLAAAGTGLLETDWVASLSTAGMAGVLSLLFSVGGETLRPTGTASFTGAVVPAQPGDVEPRRPLTDDERAAVEARWRAEQGKPPRILD